MSRVPELRRVLVSAEMIRGKGAYHVPPNTPALFVIKRDGWIKWIVFELGEFGCFRDEVLDLDDHTPGRFTVLHRHVRVGEGISTDSLTISFDPKSGTIG